MCEVVTKIVFCLHSHPDIQMNNIILVQISKSINKLSNDKGCILFTCSRFFCQEFEYFFSFNPMNEKGTHLVSVKVNLKRSPGGDNDGGKAFETRSYSYSGPRDLCHKFDLDSGVMIIMWLINGTHLSITIITYFWTMNPSRAVRSLSCLRVAIISNSCFVFFSVSASYLISLATNCFLVLLSEQFLTTAYLPLAMDRRKKLTDSAQKHSKDTVWNTMPSLISAATTQYSKDITVPVTTQTLFMPILSMIKCFR